MKVTSGRASTAHSLVCPFCESGELVFFGPGFARCASCGLPLLGSALETLRDVAGLPDAVGRHACECDHPEMHLLPDGVFHCPACRSEVLPVRVASADRNGRAGLPRAVAEGLWTWRRNRGPAGSST